MRSREQASFWEAVKLDAKDKRQLTIFKPIAIMESTLALRSIKHWYIELTLLRKFGTSASGHFCHEDINIRNSITSISRPEHSLLQK